MNDIRALAHECDEARKAIGSAWPPGPGKNNGHGHVYERADGFRARCGGPAICMLCAIDRSHKILSDREQAIAAHPTEPIAAHGAQSAPAGFVLVPAEATEDMKSAAVRYANGDAVYKNVAAAALRIEEGIYGEVYEAMLAAAPAQPAAGLVGLTESERDLAWGRYDEGIGTRGDVTDRITRALAQKNNLEQTP